MEQKVLLWMLVGLGCGALVSVLLRHGKAHLFGTMLVGSAGALLGGWGAYVFGMRVPGSPATVVAPVAGALAAIALYRVILSRRSR